MKNKIFMMTAMVFLALAVLPSVAAAVSVNSPVPGTNLSSSDFVINCTYDNVTDIVNPILANSSFYFNGTGSWQLFATRLNDFSCSATACSVTLRPDSGVTDGLGRLNCSLGNGTLTRYVSGVGTGPVRLDRSFTSASISSSPSSIQLYQPSTITWLATDSGSGVYTTAVSIVSPNTNLCPTKSYTSASGSVQITGIDTQCSGTYAATITSTDYSGNTATSSASLVVQAASGGSSQQPSAAQNNFWIWVIIMALVTYLITRGRK